MSKPLKKLILLLIGTTLLYSCENKLCGCSVPPDNSVTIFLKNSAGENLLETENYNSENIKIFNEINGEKVAVYQAFLDWPRNFHIETETDPIRMILGLNESPTELLPITYIQWNENETDILRAYIDRSDGNGYCKKLWLNNTLVWDGSIPSPNNPREITIIK